MADCQQTYGELVMNEMLDADSLSIMQQAMMLPEGMTLDKLLSVDENVAGCGSNEQSEDHCPHQR